MKCFNDRFAFCSYFLTLFSFIFVFIFQVVSWIMTIWLFGSVMIFVLARVLGGDVNYSQCLGVIGYSVLPLFVVGLILPVTHSLPWLHFIIKVSRTTDISQDFLSLWLLFYRMKVYIGIEIFNFDEWQIGQIWVCSFKDFYKPLYNS